MFVSALFRTLLCRLPVFFIIQFMKTELTVGFFFTLDILPLKEKNRCQALVLLLPLCKTFNELLFTCRSRSVLPC